MTPEHEEALRALRSYLGARGRAATTTYQFGRTATIFLNATSKPLAEIATDDVRAFLAADAEKGNSAASQRALLVHLRALFRSLHEAALVATNPTQGLSTRKPRRRAQVFLSADGLERLMAAALVPDASPSNGKGIGEAVALRTRALVEILYGVSVRASEAGRVLVTDLDLGTGSLAIRPAKRGPPRVLPLPKAAIPHLERYLREGRPKLVRPDGRDQGHFLLSRFGRPLSANQVGLVVRRLAKRAGVKASPHVFRRSSATDMVRAGINLECVRQMLGQTRLATTAIYVDVTRTQLTKAISALEQ